jgi:periplasmic divalent cation tolerance protein
MAEDALVVLSNFPNREEARRIARLLVEERLCACANILPGVESIYRWKDAIQTEPETTVMFKTNANRYYLFEARLVKLHPYEVPEVIALQVHATNFPYLSWLDECCRDATK